MGDINDDLLSIGYFSAGELIRKRLRAQRLRPIDLEEKTGIPHQRIYDFINGKRRLTVEASIKIEEALKIKAPSGYYYRMQARHDIYLYKYPKDGDRK